MPFAPRFLLLAMVLLLPPVAEMAGQSPSDSREGRDAAKASWFEALPPDVQAFLSVERYWHASRVLDEQGWNPGGGLDRITAARIAAGWRNWAGVVEMLSDPEEVPAGERGDALLLLARAREALEDWEDAAGAYRSWLAIPQPADPAERTAISVRLARSLARSGNGPAATLQLQSLSPRYPFLSSWARLEGAEILSPDGDTASVGRLVSGITDDEARDRARLLLPDAHLEADDTLAAMEAFQAAAEQGGAPSRTALAWSRLGDLLLLRADTAGAHIAYSSALSETVRGSGAARAATGLLRLGETDADLLLRMADAFRLAGEQGRGVRAYAAWLRLDSTGELSLQHRLHRARMLEISGSRGEAIEELRMLADLDDSTFAAPALVELSRIRRRQGRQGDRRALEDELIRRFPSRAESVDLVFFRGDAAHDAGDFDGAASRYREVVSMASSLNRAGLARMRWGQVRVHQGRWSDAAQIYEGYLSEFPEGRRWDEASYWAAYARLQLGDTGAAEGHLDRVRAQDPLSYYWVLGSELIGRPYEVELVPDQILDPPPDWVAVGLSGLDLLEEAGLDAARREAASRLILQAEEDGPALLALAEGLNRAGLTWDGITVARSVLAMGYGWDRRILRAVFPFPNQEAVEQEARERGVDPFLVAAIIRQESAFYSSAVSSAGAVGMMQVMPATGEQLARSVGPRGFTRETLFTPEINVHLGSTFLADLLNRFGPEVPYVLSAYNAGPSRLRRWRQFPEADDPLRYTERIPFEETRGYVKAVSRNAALYRWLYGPGLGAADGP